MRIIPIPVPIAARGRRAGARVTALAIALAVAGCGGTDDGGASAASGGDAGGAARLSVVAGFYPLAEAAARVGGDRVAVDDLTPAGAEPHDLELSPDQVEALEDADLVVVLGQGFQPAAEEVAARRDGATLQLLDVLVPDGAAGGRAGGHEPGHDDHEGGADPHLWLDPTRMAAMVAEIAGALGELDPDGAGAYAANAAAYREELAALDADFARALRGCAGEVIVVAHEAFGWLAERYGLVQEGISGLAPGSEPSPDRLSELADLVQEEQVTTVFTETLVSPRISETLAREAGVRTAVLDPIEGLSDERVAEGATYTTVMRDNLAALAEALPCATPQ